MVELWHEYLHVTCFWSHKIKPENLMLPFRGLDNWHKLLIQAEMGYSINPLWTNRFQFPP